MLQKYHHFTKTARHQDTCFYSAIENDLGQPVTLKRVKSPLSWDNLLTHPHLLLQKNSKMHPRIIEIFKHKGDFFIVQEAHTHRSLSHADPVPKMPLDEFVVRFSELLNCIEAVARASSRLPVVFPEWVCLHRHTLKLHHFAPFLSPELTSSEHVVTRTLPVKDTRYDEDVPSSINVIPREYQESLIYQLGFMAYRLLTGSRERAIKSEKEYEMMVEEVKEQGQRLILKHTGDHKMSVFVMKMFFHKMAHTPTFDQARQFFATRAEKAAKTLTTKELKIDIQLERLLIEQTKPLKAKRGQTLRGLEVTPHSKPRKFKRIRLVTEGDEPAQQTEKKEKKKLPWVGQRNNSCINRHNPMLSIEHRYPSRPKYKHMYTHDYINRPFH